MKLESVSHSGESLKVEKPANLEGLEFKTGLSAITNMLKACSDPW